MWGQTKRRGNWKVTHLTLAEEANWDCSVRCHTSDYLCVDCCWYFDFCVDLFPNFAIQRNIIVAMCEVRLQNWGWICWGASFCWCFGVWARQAATDSSRKQMCADDIKCIKAFQQVTNASPLCSGTSAQHAPDILWCEYRIRDKNNTNQDVQYPIISYWSNIQCQYPTKRTQSAKTP